MPAGHSGVRQNDVTVVRSTQGDGADREDDAPFWRARLTNDEFNLPHWIHRPGTPPGILPGRTRSREGAHERGRDQCVPRVNHNTSTTADSNSARTRTMTTPTAA